MAFGKNNSTGNETAPPKKADVILKANREILSKQDEIIRQSKLSDSRLNAAIEMFTKNMQDMTFLSKQSSEIFSRVQAENASLKQELLYLAKQNENIYTGLCGKIAELSARLEKLESAGGKPEGFLKGSIAVQTADVKIDYDKIAEKVAAVLPVTEELSPDYIASKVSEQIILPAAGGADAVDEDELADAVALKVGSLKAEDFEILVDDEGCASISKEVADNLRGALTDAVANQVRETLELQAETDEDELAARLSERIRLPELSEDAIADKAAAVLSNYLPEIDEDAIADKIVAALQEILGAQPVAARDDDALCNAITEKLIATRENDDYEIVLDEEGIAQIVGLVSEELKKETAERLDKIDEELAEIRKLLESGTVVSPSNEIATAESAAEVKDLAEDGIVTVSDLVEREEESDGEDDDMIEEIGEVLSDAEVMPDGLSAVPGGVDFANMMKYNRSFIARIIQGTDEQKRYYGSVKHALLSYKKVNSNVAWGAERFNKGRETIARLKIRGKTLCLYLALNPNDYPVSVYHHADVSDNKSMSGTPMMVKVKSPRGVKKAIRLIDELLAKRGGERREIPERDYATMYPYETIEQLIEDGLVKDVSKNRQ